MLHKHEEAKVELVQMLVQNICHRRASLVVIIDFPRHVIILSLIRALSLTRRSMKKKNKNTTKKTYEYNTLLRIKINKKLLNIQFLMSAEEFKCSQQTNT